MQSASILHFAANGPDLCVACQLPRCPSFTAVTALCDPPPLPDTIPPLPHCPRLHLTWRLAALDLGKVLLHKLPVRVRRAASCRAASLALLPLLPRRRPARAGHQRSAAVKLAHEGQLAVADAAHVALRVDGFAVAAVRLAAAAVHRKGAGGEGRNRR